MNIVFTISATKLAMAMQAPPFLIILTVEVLNTKKEKGELVHTMKLALLIVQ